MTLVLLAAMAVVGCAGDPKQPTADDRRPDPIEEVVDRCEEPPELLLDRIAERLTVDAELEHARAVASDEREGLQFVAAEVIGDELDDEAPIGAWGVLGDDGKEPEVLSVNAVARYLSAWPDGTRKPHRLTMEVDGGEASEECVEAAGE